MDKPLLDPFQERALKVLFADDWVRRHFYLTGGTALAGFHYGHRYSEDLDLFTHGVDLAPVDPILRDAAAALGTELAVEASSPSYRRTRLGGLKVDFVREVDFRVGSPLLVGEVMVDCVKNIAVNKVCAIYGRLDAKDYVDLHEILRRESWDIFGLLDLARGKDTGIEPFQWAQVIADVEGLRTFPRMTGAFDPAAVVRTFKGLRDRILDRLRPEG